MAHTLSSFAQTIGSVKSEAPNEGATISRSLEPPQLAAESRPHPPCRSFATRCPPGTERCADYRAFGRIQSQSANPRRVVCRGPSQTHPSAAVRKLVTALSQAGPFTESRI